MRESVGALSIFSIVMTFIILFTAYLAVSVNYAKAFRIKNTLITKIENHEGYDVESDEFAELLDQVLTADNYNTVGPCSDSYDSIDDEGESPVWENIAMIGKVDSNNARACIYARQGDRTNRFGCPRYYYKVKVFFKIDLPVLGDLLTFGVNGDTRGVYNNTGDNNCVQDTDTA